MEIIKKQGIELSKYVVINVLEKGLLFLIAPIMVSLLGLVSYGDFLFAKTIIILTSIVISNGIESYASVKFVKFQKSWEWNYILVLVGNAIALFLVLNILPHSILPLNLSDKCLILLAALGRSAFLIHTNFFRIASQTNLLMKNKLLAIGLEVLLLIVLFQVFSDWRIPIYATLGGQLSIISFHLIKNSRMKFNVNFRDIKKIYIFGSGMIIHSISVWAISFSDQAFIKNFSGSEQVGIYGAIVTVSMLISLIARSFNEYWSPILFRKLEANSKESINKVHSWYAIIIIVISIVCYIAFIPLFEIFFPSIGSPNVEEIAIWIIGAYLLNSLYFIPSNYLFYKLKSHFLSMVSVLAGLINLLLNYLWIKEFGILGAAKATFIAFLVQTLLVYLNAAYTIKIKRGFSNAD